MGEVNCPRPMIAHSHVHGNTATIVASDAAAEMMPTSAPMAAAMPRAMNAMAKSTNTENSAGASRNAAGGRSAGPSAAAAGAQLRLQQAFKVTALFKVAQTGPDGKATVEFPAPDNLGRFVVRAYVAAPKAAVKAASSSSSGVVYGAGESQLIVRRTVSMVPSLPRQVRVGDAFTAGVLVEAPGTVAEVAVTVTASMQQPGSAGSSNSSTNKTLRLRGEDSRTVMLSPGKPQQEVRFDFTADSIGTQNITFAATAGASAGGSGVLGARRGLRALLQWRAAAGGGSTAAAGPAAAGAVADQVQLQVPVHGKQGAVAIATSFAVRGSSDGRDWQEGMVLPRAEKGSGSIDLIAGVGSLPAIQVSSNENQKQKAYYYYCYLTNFTANSTAHGVYTHSKDENTTTDACLRCGHCIMHVSYSLFVTCCSGVEYGILVAVDTFHLASTHFALPLCISRLSRMGDFIVLDQPCLADRN